MKKIILTLVLVIIGSQALLAQSSDLENPVLENCQLAFLKENNIEISAEQAGVLRQLTVREGSHVSDDEPIAQLDDDEAKMKLHVAEQQRLAAQAKWADEIEKEYAEKAADVARANWEGLMKANSGKIKDVVIETDLRSAKLEWERALLQSKKADKDKQLAAYEYFIRKAEVEAAELEIKRRLIHAPFAGQVMELFKKQGEWVNPGDPILQFVRYDTLECDGPVFLDEYDPRDIDGCEVEVEVEVGRGQRHTARGRVSHVEQLVQYGLRRTFRVQAEIPNTEAGGRWVLTPGMSATMTIKLGTANTNVSRSE